MSESNLQTPTVAITGLGVVAPCGVGLEAFWDGLHRMPAEGDRRPIPDWDATPWFENRKQARRADAFTQYALAAAAMALEQAGDLDADAARIGTNEAQIVIRHVKGDRRVSPFLVPMMIPNAAAAAVSMRYGFQGPCEATVTACAASTHSIGNAARLITSGRCDVVLAGGSESALTPTSMAGFGNMTALTKRGISMPFDARRDGFVMGEGAGILVLENRERAEARGATILGLMLGSASTADAHHITAPSPGGAGAVRCMELAIADAGLSAADIVHVNAHGTSTPLNDAAEAEALATVFGSPGPIVTSTKGVTGHALGAAGAMEAVAVLLAMQRRLIPPTMGLEQFDPELPALDMVVGEARPWDPGPSLSNSFGFGGHNGTIVLAPAP